MSEYDEQFEMFKKEREWIEVQVCKVVAVDLKRKRPVTRRRLRELQQRNAHLKRDFARFLEAHK